MGLLDDQNIENVLAQTILAKIKRGDTEGAEALLTTHSGLKQRISRYYGARVKELEKDQNKNWERSGVSLKGWMNQFTGGLDLPFKSIAMFHNNIFII